jgi:RNA polymerase sigma-70 factor (ECF subfamily)
MFNLCRVQGKTYDEAAKLLGLSRNTVKKHMVSSMKVLKLAVQKDLGIFFVLFAGLM